MELFLFWFILAIVAGVFAGTKGRSKFGWFLLSCLVSPIIGLILIAILPRRDLERVLVHNSLEDKLSEIKSLLDRNLITQEEYEARRKVIIENTNN